MLTDVELEAVVAEGIIDAGQAKQLAAFLANRSNGDPWRVEEDETAETEDVRFARGFHDIFIAVGVGLLFVGLTTAGSVTDNLTLVLAVSTVVALGLAEFLAGKRRLVLPSIVLCLAFMLCAAGAVGSALDQKFSGLFRTGDGVSLMAMSLTGIAAALIFYLRYRLPFALGVLAAGGVALALSVLLLIDPDIVENYSIPIFLIAGLCVFAAAMAFDISDPGRKTLRADNAFWLHLLAAPLLVHSILAFVSTGQDTGHELAGAGAVIAVFLALALVALLVDRRAMLVVGLGYFGAAIATVIGEASDEAGTVAAITLIILGIGVVALGSGWQATRALLFRILPLSGDVSRKLPPVRGKS